MTPISSMTGGTQSISTSDPHTPEVVPEGLNPLSFLGEKLLTHFHLSPMLARAKRVTLLAVPGGCVIRYSREALHLEEGLRNTFQVESQHIHFQYFTRQAFIPFGRLDALLEACDIDIRAKALIEEGNPLLNNYRVHISKSPSDNLLRPAHTLSLSLAHLDPAQHQILDAYTNPLAKPEEDHPNLKLPLITHTDRGLEIWFKEGSSQDFIELVSKIFMLTSEAEVLNKPFGVYDTVIRLERKRILLFLEMMQIRDVLGDPGLRNFIDHLRALNKFHLYQPTHIPNRPLESLALSLKNILPQEPGKRPLPLIVLHPILGLVIRLPEDPHSKRLIDFLGLDHRLVSYLIDGVQYGMEVIIPTEMLAGFLRDTMELEVLIQPLLDEFARIRDSFHDIVAVRGREGRILSTISRRLYSLCGPNESAWIKGFSPLDTPERERPLPRICCSQGSMIFYFPKEYGQRALPENLLFKEQNEDQANPSSGLFSQIGNLFTNPAPGPSFLTYVSAFLGYPIEGCSKRFDLDANHYTFQMSVPAGNGGEELLGLLERGFGLKELPLNHRISSSDLPLGHRRETWWNELVFGFSRELRIPFAQHGDVNSEGLKLKAPRIELPDALPEYSEEEILTITREILTRSEMIPQKIQGIIDRFRVILHRGWRRETDTERAVFTSIMHFTYELQKVPERVSIEVKKNSIINLSLSANVCLPGVHVRLAEEIKRIAGQQINAKGLLLSTLEEWKNDLLFEIFRNFPQSAHVFAAAQVMWGDEFGLDVEAGQKDRNWRTYGEHRLNDQLKGNFRDALTNSDLLLDEVFRRANERKDDHGAILDLSIYQDSVRDLLNKKGLSPTEIDDAVETLFPTEPDTYAMTISREALKLLLIEIGILYR